MKHEVLMKNTKTRVPVVTLWWSIRGVSTQLFIRNERELVQRQRSWLDSRGGVQNGDVGSQSYESGWFTCCV